MNKWLLLGIFFVSGCQFSNSPFDANKASEFRYKNSHNQSVFLPKNAKICIQNIQNNLPKTTSALETFVRTQWQDKANLEANCTHSDFSFYLFTTKDYYGVFFRTLKLTIIEQTNRKVVANYTVYSTHQEKENLDNEAIIKAFASLFLTPQRMFNE